MVLIMLALQWGDWSSGPYVGRTPYYFSTPGLSASLPDSDPVLHPARGGDVDREGASDSWMIHRHRPRVKSTTRETPLFYPSQVGYLGSRVPWVCDLISVGLISDPLHEARDPSGDTTEGTGTPEYTRTTGQSDVTVATDRPRPDPVDLLRGPKRSRGRGRTDVSSRFQDHDPELHTGPVQ